ncbi:MAG: trehalose-6-phosphate synthase [Chloroflexi bacterium]|nr:trehalose-6-phosphate synthase [Chloroflexota bacterium]
MEPRADLILANRAYVDHLTPPGAPDGPTPAIEGGLLAAVRPLIAPWSEGTGTTWIGAGRGAHDREFTDERGFETLATGRGGLRHRRLYFDESTWNGHYSLTSNSFLWPLLHLVSRPFPLCTDYYPRPATPGADEWAAFQLVNQAFAKAGAEEGGAGSAWVHDYQLALAPAMLRESGFGGRIGYFLHTPFPDVDVAAKVVDSEGMERLAEVVAGMLGAGLVGLQSQGDADRFAQAAAVLAGAMEAPGGLAVGNRFVRVGVYPVGIDCDQLLEVARGAEAMGRVVQLRARGDPLVAGLERSDFTKGIPERLRAITSVFGGGGRFAYAGIAAPTREGVAVYRRFEEVTAAAAREAAHMAAARGRGFLHLREAIPWAEVVALQRDADVVFTSSLADGMNLVPLQAAVAQSLRAPGERATIITGKDAGVASAYAGFEEDGLVSVDPLDPRAMEETLLAAIAGELPRVSDRLIAAVREHDARAWATSFLGDLEDTEC